MTSPREMDAITRRNYIIARLVQDHGASGLVEALANYCDEAAAGKPPGDRMGPQWSARGDVLDDLYRHWTDLDGLDRMASAATAYEAGLRRRADA